MNERELWGEVRSWANGEFIDEVDRLSWLESIFERSDVPPAQVEGVSEYLKRKLAGDDPMRPHIRMEEIGVLEAWVRGQLLETLHFLHPMPNIIPKLRSWSSHELIKSLLNHRSLSVWRSYTLTFVRTSVPVDAAFGLLRWLDDLECYDVGPAKAMRHVRARGGVLDRMTRWLEAAVGVEFEASHVLESGSRGGSDVKVRVHKSHAEVEIVWTYAQDVISDIWSFELLVQIERLAEGSLFEFDPDNGVRSEFAWRCEVFAALWQVVRMIRMGVPPDESLKP